MASLTSPITFLSKDIRVHNVCLLLNTAPRSHTRQPMRTAQACLSICVAKPSSTTTTTVSQHRYIFVFALLILNGLDYSYRNGVRPQLLLSCLYFPSRTRLMATHNKNKRPASYYRDLVIPPANPYKSFPICYIPYSKKHVLCQLLLHTQLQFYFIR